MHSILKISFLSIILNFSGYNFEAVYNHDLDKLYKYKYQGDISGLKEFDQFLTLDLNDFTYNQSKKDKHKIEKWVSKDGKTSILKITTTYGEIDYNDDSLVAEAPYVFTSYQFTVKKKKYRYMSLDDQGVIFYSTPKKENTIDYSIRTYSNFDKEFPNFKSEIKDIFSKD